MGLDLSNVRLHTDSAAQESASRLSAAAYTISNHIVFGRNRFAPDTNSGAALLAHELTHVRQHAERGQTAVVHRAPEPADLAKAGADKKLQSAIELANWDDAGLLLNGYNKEAIASVLKSLKSDQIESLYLGAASKAGVGEDSQVASMALAASPRLSGLRDALKKAGITTKEFVDYKKEGFRALYGEERSNVVGGRFRSLPPDVQRINLQYSGPTKKAVAPSTQPSAPAKVFVYGASLPQEVVNSEQHKELNAAINRYAWKEVAAILNSYRVEHISIVLADLSEEERESVYIGAIAHPGVGESANVAKVVLAGSKDLQAARAEVIKAGITMKEYVDDMTDPPIVAELWLTRKGTIRKARDSLSDTTRSHLRLSTDQTTYIFRSGRTGTIAEERDRRLAEFKPKGAVAGLAEAGVRASTGDAELAENVGNSVDAFTDVVLAAAPVAGAAVQKSRAAGQGNASGSGQQKSTPTPVVGPGGSRPPAAKSAARPSASGAISKVQHPALQGGTAANTNDLPANVVRMQPQTQPAEQKSLQEIQLDLTGTNDAAQPPSSAVRSSSGGGRSGGKPTAPQQSTPSPRISQRSPAARSTREGAVSSADRQASPSAGRPSEKPSLLQQAKAAGVAEEIEGAGEPGAIFVVVHGTTETVADEMISTSGGNLSGSSEGGNFGGRLYAVPSPQVASVFASRAVDRAGGGAKPALVGIALPSAVVARLRSGPKPLLLPLPIENPPDNVKPGTTQWIFEPGAIGIVKQHGFFFRVEP
jgi:hypothetical protein